MRSFAFDGAFAGLAGAAVAGAPGSAVAAGAVALLTTGGVCDSGVVSRLQPTVKPAWATTRPSPIKAVTSVSARRMERRIVLGRTTPRIDPRWVRQGDRALGDYCVAGGGAGGGGGGAGGGWGGGGGGGRGRGRGRGGGRGGGGGGGWGWGSRWGGGS